MVFSTLEHILTHISFSVVSLLISIHLITLLLGNEIIGLDNSFKKGMIITFFCITGLLVTRWIFSGHLPFSNLYESLIFLSWTFSIFYMVLCLKKKKKLLFQYNNNAKYSFYPRLCYFGSFNRNASILNISACFTVPLVNDARKYDDIGLYNSFMWIIIISGYFSHYFSRTNTHDW